MKLIDKIKGITAVAVAKKQDAAKLNFPSIVEKIEQAAELGESSITIPMENMNTYDQALLTAEGFICVLTDKPVAPSDTKQLLSQYVEGNVKIKKVWLIRW